MDRPTIKLGALTSPEAAQRALVLAVPLGSTEQHGPHLPLDTDTRIAVAVADGLAEQRHDVVVAPPIGIGASGEHAGFAGTLSIGTEALQHALVEITRSIGPEFRALVFVNGHGGNVRALRAAVELARSESREVTSWSPLVPGGDAHAGRTETSLMLAIAPELVRLERAEAGNTQPLSVLGPKLWTGGLAAVAPNGVLGDPTGVSAAEGDSMLRRLIDDLASVTP